MPKDTDLHIRLDADLRRSIDRAAALDRRKASDWIRLTLEEAAQRRIKTNGNPTGRRAS